METQKIELYLESIRYGGDNMGKELSIAIRALQTDFNLAIKLRHGKERKFDPLPLVAEGDIDPTLEEVRRKIRIAITETDPVTSDRGQSDQFHTVPATSAGRFTLSQEVSVMEEGDQEQSGKVGLFTFTFLMVLPLFGLAEGGMKLPELRAPVVKGNERQSGFNGHNYILTWLSLM